MYGIPNLPYKIRQIIKRVFIVHAFLVNNRNVVIKNRDDISSVSLHAYYNLQVIRFVLRLPKNLWPSKQWVKYLFNFAKSTAVLVWRTLQMRRFRHLKQLGESNRHNKYYWSNSKWNQISLMYIWKIIYIKNKECVHCGLYQHFMVFTGPVSVPISLSFIAMFTWNTTEILPNWDLKG